jgi:hypothetical protein
VFAPCAPSLSRNLRVPSLSRLQMRAVQANRGMASSVQGLYMAELAKIAARKEDGVRSFSFSRAGCRSPGRGRGRARGESLRLAGRAAEPDRGCAGALDPGGIWLSRAGVPAPRSRSAHRS